MTKSEELDVKQWVKKLLEQLDLGSSDSTDTGSTPQVEINEDRATLLYIIDTYSKHLIEVDSRSVRKMRAVFDEFAKGLLRVDGPNSDKLLFRFRQFFSGYRIQEYSYLQKTFEDFKSIIWDFADQLNEGMATEQARDVEVRSSLNSLREAVEANSIGELKEKSREFIDFYIELQTRNDEKRSARIDSIQKNLATVKKKLSEVTHTAQHDHLTGAYNRKYADELFAKVMADFQSAAKTPVSIVALDIDYFKKINDIFGHDTGDVVLKEFARLLREVCNGKSDAVVRMGGEEFTVILPGVPLMEAVKKTEEILQRIRKEVIIHSDTQIRYTSSAGVAQLAVGESLEKWLKRADTALYSAKETGRDKYIVAPTVAPTSSNVA